jgi:hypothetical protein
MYMYLGVKKEVVVKNISIKDTSDGKYKKIRRLTSQPHYLIEDTSP